MSADAVSWAFRQIAAKGDKFVLVAIAEHANPAGVCFPGQERLAAMCCCDASSIVRAMSKLEDGGLIGRTERRRPNGSKTSDWIVLAPHKVADERLPLRPPSDQEHYPEGVSALFSSPCKTQDDSSGVLQDESHCISSGSHCVLQPPHIAFWGGPEPTPEEPTSEKPSPDCVAPPGGLAPNFRIAAQPMGGVPPASTASRTRRGRARRGQSGPAPADVVQELLDAPSPSDLSDWAKILERLAEVVDESTFALWLKPLALAGVDENGTLVLTPPREQSAGWVSERFGNVLAASAEFVRLELRVVDAGVVSVSEIRPAAAG